jgi:hypothetical protein
MKFWIIFLLGIFCHSVWGQTFNKRFDLSSPNSLFGSVIATDSMYYVTGTKIDSLPPYLPHGFFASIDLTGEMTLLNFERDTQYVKYRGFPYLHKLDDTFIVGGKRVATIGFALLSKLDIYGNIIWEREFQSYHAEEENYGIGVGDLAVASDKSVYMLNSIISILGKNQKAIIKTDSVGNTVWHELQGDASDDSRSGVISMASDGSIWMAQTIVDDDFSLPLFKFQTRTSKIDTSGNLLWEHITPLSQGQIGYIGGLVEADDGGLIINALYGYENQDGWPRYMEWEKYIYKISSEGELVWELEIPAPWLSTVQVAWRMIKVSDGSGYVAIADDLHYSGFDGDSISYHGWMGKIDDNGNLLWARTYTGVDSDDNRQLLYDVKEASNGGFVAVGFSRDYTADTLQQQAWIIKTDEYGCIVPGCNITSTKDPETSQISLSLYPNPSSDILNIWYASADFNPRQPPQFQVTDMQGRVWKSFSADTNNVTLMLSVQDLPVGSYVLTCSEKEGGLPFVIAR